MSRMKHRWILALVAVAVAVAAAAVPARAQLSVKKAAYREGFWIGVGLAYGNAGISCTGCSNNDRYGAPTVAFRLGGTVNQHLLLGGELNAWSRSTSGVTETVGDVSAALYFYPSVSGGFFLKGGVGVVVYQANTSPKLTTNGVGLNVGAGVDLYVSKKFSLTPFVSFVSAVGGTAKLGGTDTGIEARPNLAEIGVSAVWH